MADHKPTIPRARVIPTLSFTHNTEALTLPDYKTIGSVPPVSQYKKSTYGKKEIEDRKKRAKHFPLKNGLPYVPSYMKSKEGAINMFDPSIPTLQFAASNIKEPYDSLLKDHRLASQRQVVNALKREQAASVETDWRRAITENYDAVKVREMHILPEHPHDIQKHRNDRLRNGIVDLNAFESTQKVLNLIKDLTSKNQGAAGRFA